MVKTLAFVGDSLTHTGDWSQWLTDYEVHNLGVGGETSKDLISRVNEIVALEPDAIVLLIGTNDLAWRRTVEHVVRNVETVLVDLRRALPETRILVQSLLPRAREFAPAIRDVNRHLRQFAPTVYAHYLDLWPVLAMADGELNTQHSSDRLHLEPSGYEVWCAELVPALERLFSEPPTSRSIRTVTQLASSKRR